MLFRRNLLKVNDNDNQMPLTSGSLDLKSHSRVLWKNTRQADIACCVVKMRLSFVCVLHVAVWSIHNALFLMRRRMVSWGTSFQTWQPKASIISLTATWCWWMEQDIMSQMCSIEFRSGEQVGQSIATVPSYCKNCTHTEHIPATWVLALLCSSRDPGKTAPV